jgi:hypothetical protein
MDTLRLPAVGPVVVKKERARHPEPVVAVVVKVVVMVKVVMCKALPVKFATHAATASLAHMAFGKTSTDATAAMGGKSSATEASGMAATL